MGTQSASASLAPDTPRRPPSATSSQVGRPTLLSSVFVCVSSQNPQPRPRVRAVTTAAGPLDSRGGRPGWGRRLLRLHAIVPAAPPPPPPQHRPPPARVSAARSRRGRLHHGALTSSLRRGPGTRSLRTRRMGSQLCRDGATRTHMAHARTHAHTAPLHPRPRLGARPAPADTQLSRNNKGRWANETRRVRVNPRWRSGCGGGAAAGPEPRCDVGTSQGHSPRCWGIAETRAPSEGEPPSDCLFCCITNLPEIPHLKSDLTSLKCIFWTQWKASRPFTWSVLSPRCSPLRVLPGRAASVSGHPPREARCPHRATAGACVVHGCVWLRQTSVRGLAPRGPLASPSSERQPPPPGGSPAEVLF